MANTINTSKVDAYVMTGPVNTANVSKVDAYVMIGPAPPPPPPVRVVARMSVTAIPS